MKRKVNKKPEIKKKKGITLIALVTTIILILILTSIAISNGFGDNGLFKRAEKAKIDQSKIELFEVASIEFQSMDLHDMIQDTDTYSFKTFYASNAFNSNYYISGTTIMKRDNNSEVMDKQELEDMFRKRIKELGRITARPQVNPITNEDNRISGVGEPKAEIIITINGNEYKTRVKDDGTWEVQVPKQSTDTKIKIVQKDRGKVESIDTIVTVVKPKLEKPVIKTPIYASDTNIEYTGEVGAKLKVTMGDKELVVNTLEPNWSVELNFHLIAGSVISFVQTKEDKQDSDAVTYIIALPRSEMPTVDTNINVGTTKVHGKGITGSRIIVRSVATNKEYLGGVGNDGKWTTTIEKLPGDTKVEIFQETPGRSRSIPNIQNVRTTLEKTNKPTYVSDIDSNSTNISGTGIKGATIIVKLDNGSEPRTIVGQDGHWNMGIPRQKGGNQIFVTQKSNESGYTESEKIAKMVGYGYRELSFYIKKNLLLYETTFDKTVIFSYNALRVTTVDGSNYQISINNGPWETRRSGEDIVRDEFKGDRRENDIPIRVKGKIKITEYRYFYKARKNIALVGQPRKSIL